MMTVNTVTISNPGEMEWNGLLYIRATDAVLPYGVTIYPRTFHYDATGTLRYVYDEVGGVATPRMMWTGITPMTRVPKSLRQLTEIGRDVVYHVVSHGDEGIIMTVYCNKEGGNKFFFPYDTDHRRKRSPWTQNEIVAVLVRAHNNGDWRTFWYWINYIRPHPKRHTVRAIHHNS